jgi:hypothetical protein
VHAIYRLHVVRKNFWTSITHHLNGAFVSQKVPNQTLNTHARASAMHGTNRFRPDFRAAIGQLIAIHTGDDYVL